MNNSFRASCSKVINSFYFNAFIMMVIILNAIVIGIQTYDLDPEVEFALFIFDGFCVVVYLLEAILKIYVLRWDYFKDGWNVFDFVILVLALIPAGILPVSPAVARVLRVFRAFRAFRLITVFKRVRIIVEALLKAIPSVIWTTILLQIIFYVYAVCGVMLFGDTFPQYFGDLSTAFFMMFQFVTLDSWGAIAREIMQVQPMAWIYFFSFIIIAAFIVMNVFIGIIVGTMDRSREQVEQERAKSEQNRIEFSAWLKVMKTKDKAERRYLRSEFLKALLAERKEIIDIENEEEHMRELREKEAHERMSALVEDALEGEEIELPNAIAIHNEFTDRMSQEEESLETEELISRIIQETLDEHKERVASARAQRQQEILSSEQIEELMSRVVQETLDEHKERTASARAQQPQKEILSSEQIEELMSRAVEEAFVEHREHVASARAQQPQKEILSSEQIEELVSRAVEEAFVEQRAYTASARAQQPQKEMLSSEQIEELMTRVVEEAFVEHRAYTSSTHAKYPQRETLASENAEELSNEIADLRERLDVVVSLLEKQSQNTK